MFFTFDVSFFDQNITFFASSVIAMLRTTNLIFFFQKKRIIDIFAASITVAPLTCWFDWLAYLIISLSSIGSLNKQELAEML